MEEEGGERGAEEGKKTKRTKIKEKRLRRVLLVLLSFFLRVGFRFVSLVVCALALTHMARCLAPSCPFCVSLFCSWLRFRFLRRVLVNDSRFVCARGGGGMTLHDLYTHNPEPPPSLCPHFRLFAPLYSLPFVSLVCCVSPRCSGTGAGLLAWFVCHLYRYLNLYLPTMANALFASGERRPVRLIQNPYRAKHE